MNPFVIYYYHTRDTMKIMVIALTCSFSLYTMEKKVHAYTITNYDSNTVLVTTSKGTSFTLTKLKTTYNKELSYAQFFQAFEEFVADQLRQIFCCFRKKKKA